MATAQDTLKKLILDGPYVDFVNYHQAYAIHIAARENFDECKSFGAGDYLNVAFNHATTTMSLTTCRLFESLHQQFKKRSLPYLFDFIYKNKADLTLANPYSIGSQCGIDDAPSHEEYIEIQLAQWWEEGPTIPKKGLPPKDHLSRRLLRVKKFRDQHVAHNDLELFAEHPTYADMHVLVKWAERVLWELEFYFFGYLSAGGALTHHAKRHGLDILRQFNSLVIHANEAKKMTESISERQKPIIPPLVE